MRHISGSVKTHLHWPALVVATSLLAFGFADRTDAGTEAGTGGCSSRVVALESDGTSSARVEDEKYRAELGEYVKSCIYTLGTDALEETLGDCVVSSVTFEGSEPAPRLLTVNKGWDEVVAQAEVTQSNDELAWAWTGDGLNCDEPGCLDGEVVQIHLFGSGFGLSDGVENCPWSRVQARFELARAP